MTALGQAPGLGTLQAKPLSAKERRRRRRAKARAKARARARAKAAAAKAKAEAQARADAAERARAAAAKAKADAAKPATSGPSTPVTPAPALSSLDRHYLDRFSYGYSRDTAIQVAAAGGGRAWFEQQLSPAAISDPLADAMVADHWWPVLQKDYAGQWKDHNDGVRRTWEAGSDLSRLSLARKVVSTRQLHEMMSEFWLNHLYIPSGEDRSSVHRSAYEDLIRSHALGSFSDMLAAAITHPAMIGFLTNYQNTARALNENLGREVLELHTVGVGAGYGEDGVKASTRLLTGFTLDAFRTWAPGYDTSRHHVGAVTVLGRTFANASADGRATVDEYLRFLAGHDLTAARLARKLCVRFVSDTPSDSIVDAVKSAYLTSRTDIRATLRALVAHPDFENSRNAKVRTPVEDVLGTARAVGARPLKPSTGSGAEGKNFVTHLGWMSENMGYRPYTWPRPDGPPDVASAWTGSSRILRTWENRFSLAAGWWKSQDVTYAALSSYLPTAWPRRVDEIVDHVSVELTGVRPSAAARTAVLDLLGMAPSKVITKAADVNEWDMTRMRGVLLNAPENLLR